MLFVKISFFTFSINYENLNLRSSLKCFYKAVTGLSQSIFSISVRSLWNLDFLKKIEFALSLYLRNFFELLTGRLHLYFLQEIALASLFSGKCGRCLDWCFSAYWNIGLVLKVLQYTAILVFTLSSQFMPAQARGRVCGIE